MKNFDFDLFVIGGGSGGVRAARFASLRGAKVALAEVSKMGGTCVNVGCIPKKLYSFAAHYAEGFEQAKGYGFEVGKAPALNWANLKTARAAEITRLNGVYENIMKNANVTKLEGFARVSGANQVIVKTKDGSEQKYSAKNILIATGSTPFKPDVKGAELAITSDDVFDLQDFPRRMVVVGGGYIGCEMASIFNGLGSNVSLIYRGNQLLRGFDDEVREFASEEIKKHGVDVRLECDVEKIELIGDMRRVYLTDGSYIDADAVLYATGRKAMLKGLGLEELGATFAKSGAIEVDEKFETKASGIFAIGDILGGARGRKELTPVALAEGMALVDGLFGAAKGNGKDKPAFKIDYENIATAVFTHPEIGTVGLSEEAARAEGRKIRVYRSDFKPLQHTLSKSSERTLVKMIVDDESDKVLGLHMVGANAGEITQGFAVAMKCGATKAQFDATIGIHPTSAEEFVTMREVSRN